MALEISSALIREIQLSLRREAGVPSYNPADPALPNLPTIQEAISALDPSLPSHLRCRRCRGGLLRGPESTICVFCGADRRREAPPQAISFNSTAACRKLLESLDLDGSEPVTLDAESINSSKGHNAPKDGLVLSELLNLELRWPLEKEEIDSSITNKAPSENSYALNLSGVDLDTFFSDSNDGTTINAVSLSSEQLMPKKQIVNIDNRASADSQNFGFSENVQSSDMTVSSADTKSGDFGDSFAVWEADFQSASSEAFAAESKSVGVFQGSSTAGFVNLATTTATFSQQTTIEHETSIKDNDAQISSSSSWIQDDLWSQMNREVVNTADQLKSIGETNNSELKNDLNCMTSVSNSWAQDGLLPSSSTKELNNTKDVDDSDDTLDAWQDFTGSGEALGDLSNPWTGNVTVDSSTKVFKNSKNSDHNDDLLDAWQDFASSGEAQGASNSWTHNGTEATSYEHASGMKSGDIQDMEFGSFLHSDSFARALGGEEGPCEANLMQLGPSVSDRMNGTSGESGEDSNATADLDSSSSNVENLLSQMHDLSFMLESNLSIPKKVDGYVLKP